MNKKRFLAFALCLCIVFLSACSAKTESADTSANADSSEASTTLPTEEVIDITTTLDPIKTQIDEICKKYEATGVQIAVLKDGKLYGTHQYGMAIKEDEIPVTEDTKFRIASLSKLITDIVFMRLSEEGLVSLDEDISTYLGFEVRNPRYPDAKITPAMLMSHMSSIIDSQHFLEARLDGSSEKLQTLLERKDSYSGAEPGTDYSYSNFGIAIIGCICEKVTGKGFDQLADEYIFDLLGIDAGYTATNIKDQKLLGALYGEGGRTVEQQLEEKFCDELGQTYHLVQGNLTISAKDYITIASVMCNDGLAADGTQILKKESVDRMLADPVGFGFEKNANVIEGKDFIFHTGCNFGMFSGYVIEPATDFGICVLTSGAPGTKDEASYIYKIILEIIRVSYDFCVAWQ